MKIFHYLFEQHPGVTEVYRTGNVVSFALHDFERLRVHELSVDERDQRVLVAFDGELLWESVPKAGDLLVSIKLGEFTTPAAHLRASRFGLEPSYVTEEVSGKKIARLAIFRHFLLVPAGVLAFRRVRDRRSLGPMYVFAEIRKEKSGPQVTWRNTTY